MNTMKDFKDALDTAIYAYGNTLIEDMEATGLTADMSQWLSLALSLSLKLDEVLNKEEQ